MILYIVLAIVLTVALVWLIDKFVPNKFRPVIHIVLWIVIAALGYLTFMSVYEEIQFNQVKKKRYAVAIEKLIDIRDSQLAYKDVKGKFTKNYDSLIKFIETGKFTLIERRDTSIVDVELTKRYGGVETLKDSIIIDTLGFVSVKDSLFKSSTRYKDMMNVPFAKEGTKFKLDAGSLEESDVKIPVFEASVKKREILHDQPNDLILKENQVISVEGVNGDAIKVGSMNEVKTIGNWPKTYGSSE